MNRRQFLTATSVMAASVPLLGAEAAGRRPSPPKPPLVGSQLYGWGQYYGRDGKDLMQHLDEVLSALRDAGYDYAEGSLDSGTPENNAKFAERLRAKGLRPASLYTGGAIHQADRADETVQRLVNGARAAREAGFGIINFNPDPIGRAKTDDELAVQTRALTQLGEELAKLDLRLGIHHHTPELADGAKEFHTNFRRCAPDRVGFCYDVHWVYRGGIQPLDCLREYGGRVVSWHLRQSRGQIWWEDLDTGDLDYAAIASFAKERRLPAFYTVELALEPGTKITRTVVENHARSRAFVKRVFGA